MYWYINRSAPDGPAPGGSPARRHRSEENVQAGFHGVGKNPKQGKNAKKRYFYETNLRYTLIAKDLAILRVCDLALFLALLGCF